MQLAARTGAWAKSGPTAKDYVQDGLIAMWDGIENAGWGVHDPNATVWKDLSGNDNDLTCRKTGLFTYDSIYCDGTSWSAYRNGRVYYKSIECVFKTKSFTYVKSNTSGERTIFYAGSPSRLLNTPELRTDQTNELYIPRGSVELYSIDSKNVIAAKIASDGSKHQIHALYADEIDGLPIDAYFNGKQNITHTKWNWGAFPDTVVGDRQIDTLGWPWNGWVNSIRLYNRALTSAEIAANYAIDKARFNLPDAA